MEQLLVNWESCLKIGEDRMIQFGECSKDGINDLDWYVILFFVIISMKELLRTISSILIRIDLGLKMVQHLERVCGGEVAV